MGITRQENKLSKITQRYNLRYKFFYILFDSDLFLPIKEKYSNATVLSLKALDDMVLLSFDWVLPRFSHNQKIALSPLISSLFLHMSLNGGGDNSVLIYSNQIHSYLKNLNSLFP